jgi:hypothetical protein
MSEPSKLEGGIGLGLEEDAIVLLIGIDLN